MTKSQTGPAARLRIAVVSPVDPRWARTNTVSDVRLCAALKSQGHEVQWIVPSVGPSREISSERVLSMHDVRYPFQIHFVRTPRRDGPRDVARVLPLVLSQLREALFSHRYDHVISRDMRLLLALLGSRARGRAVPWLHEYRGRVLEKFACRRASCVLATNSAIVGDLRRHAPHISTFVTGNPVLDERVAFGRKTTKEEARQALGIEFDQPLIVYTGKVYPGMREVEHLLYAASRLEKCQFLMTGGQPSAIRVLRTELAERRIDNVILTGFLEKPEATRHYQQAADVLVSYYSVADHPHARHNLPGKLAEYMSTGNPTVVADFPAVRDWATRETAVLVEPDNPTALMEALMDLLQDPVRAAEVAAQAQRLAQDRSFERVAAELGTFLAATASSA